MATYAGVPLSGVRTSADVDDIEFANNTFTVAGTDLVVSGESSANAVMDLGKKRKIIVSYGIKVDQQEVEPSVTQVG